MLAFYTKVARNSRCMVNPPVLASQVQNDSGAIQVQNDSGPSDSKVMHPEVSSERQGAARDVSDTQGKKWRVREMEMPESSGSAPRKSLIALNEMVIRRFWSFPPLWRELSDAALLALINGPVQPHPETLQDPD